MLHGALAFQPIQERVERSAFATGEAGLPQDLGDGVAFAVPVAEHREHRLRQRGTDKLLLRVGARLVAAQSAVTFQAVREVADGSCSWDFFERVRRRVTAFSTRMHSAQYAAPAASEAATASAGLIPTRGG